MSTAYLPGAISPRPKNELLPPLPMLGRPVRFWTGPNGDGLSGSGTRGRPLIGLVEANCGEVSRVVLSSRPQKTGDSNIPCQGAKSHTP